MSDAPSISQGLKSVCVYCASSNAADPTFFQSAERFGTILAQSGVRLVYGGGGIGLMGAAARGAHGAGGRVLGIMPAFLTGREILYDQVETIVVQSMHERKQIMFEQSDAFAILPGGLGTLEEIVELMSWRRLDLHQKPIVFYNPGGFWEPLFKLVDHTIEQNLTPAWFRGTWQAVDDVEQLLPAIRQMMRAGPQRDPTGLV
jgi:uncharacterized protein (TIGR00730 family)